MAPPCRLSHRVFVTHDGIREEWLLILPADPPFVLSLRNAIHFAAFVPAPGADASLLQLFDAERRWVALSHWEALHAFARVMVINDDPVGVQFWLALGQSKIIFLGAVWERILSAL